MNTDIVFYYKERAPEYDTVYLKPERQESLAQATSALQNIFSNKEVLEIACGTGYWTEGIAVTAKSILATDINQTVIDLALQKNYPKKNVSFQLADFFSLDLPHHYESLFGGFIWSHIKLEQLENFVDTVISNIESNGTVVFMDNNYVEGSSIPITNTDAAGNTYQTRYLNGSPFLMLKNFPTEEAIKSVLANRMSDIRFIQLQYYWIVVAQKL